MAVQEMRCPYCSCQFMVQENQPGMQFTCPVCGKQFAGQTNCMPPPVCAGNTCYNGQNNDPGTCYQYKKPNMLTALTKYADFRGRASRREYWLFTIFNFLVQLALGVIGGILTVVLESVCRDQSVAIIINSLFSILSSIVGFAFFIPSLAVAVRRCHDTGRSGWYILMNLIPCVGPIIYLITVCRRSQSGFNQWGPDPVGDGEDEVWPCVVGVIVSMFLPLLAMSAMLAAILLPAINSARERGRQGACINNLKQIGSGLFMYTNDYDYYFPPAKGEDGLGLLRESDLLTDHNVYKCPSVENGSYTYYYLGDGLKYRDITSASSTPVVICNHHGDEQVHILYADSHVATLRGRYDTVEEIVMNALNFDNSSPTAKKVLKNARKIDNSRH